MSARRQVVSLVCGLCFGAVAGAQEQPETDPEAEFLEYLGMWEQTDEEWLLHDDAETVVVKERSEPAPEGEDSTEIEDEG